MTHMLGTRARVAAAPWWCCPGHTPAWPRRHALRTAKHRERAVRRRTVRRDADDT